MHIKFTYIILNEVNPKLKSHHNWGLFMVLSHAMLLLTMANLRYPIFFKAASSYIPTDSKD
jgi:hypothetical protein